ncbi:hypothetical protein IVB25_23515 [Bradyrhizobium sp. 193]|uniref:hypothetical protein n=1 Tax=Bradyrhizobium sp. 193 TaxID=2782661 RepID=UPI001FF867C9|nr:hypothetical protein [Bradyrhizobium sp. 193]MCK1485578.1 hypothetical protein [Bradyrhizobium sp. 193]
MNDHQTDDPSNRFKSKRSIQEFRIDFFLEEEFLVDPAFGRAFLSACRSHDRLESVEGVYHQPADKHCIADLIVMASVVGPDSNPARLALLIENKITAAAQPQQADRYRKRGATGVSQGLWDRYLTVLVAPASYIAAGHGYDNAVPLETIKEWIPTSDQKRRAIKHAILDAAIAKRNATGIQIVDPVMTNFRRLYFEYVQDFNRRTGSDFLMSPPRPAWFDDTWFKFREPSMPLLAEFRHLSRTGNIGLDLKGVQLGSLGLLQPLLEDGMYLEPVGRKKQNASIKKMVGAIRSFEDFEAEKDKVEAALVFAQRITRIWIENRPAFDEVLTSAASELPI